MGATYAGAKKNKKSGRANRVCFPGLPFPAIGNSEAQAIAQRINRYALQALQSPFLLSLSRSCFRLSLCYLIRWLANFAALLVRAKKRNKQGGGKSPAACMLPDGLGHRLRLFLHRVCRLHLDNRAKRLECRLECRRLCRREIGLPDTLPRRLQRGKRDLRRRQFLAFLAFLAFTVPPSPPPLRSCRVSIGREAFQTVLPAFGLSANHAGHCFEMRRRFHFPEWLPVDFAARRLCFRD